MHRTLKSDSKPQVQLLKPMYVSVLQRDLLVGINTDELLLKRYHWFLPQMKMKNALIIHLLGKLRITTTFALLFREQNHTSVVFTYEIYKSLPDSRERSFLVLTRPPCADNMARTVFLSILYFKYLSILKPGQVISQIYCPHGPLSLYICMLFPF